MLPGPGITGLAAPEQRSALARRAASVAAFLEGGGTLGPEQRRHLLTTAANTSLTFAGVPAVTSSFAALPPDTAGTVSPSTWDLVLDQRRWTASSSPRAEVAEAANTTFHESRHAEQHFRVARLLAAGGASAGEIADRTGIRETVAAAAVADPLRVPETGRTPEQLEAEQWYHSFHGEGAADRLQTLRGTRTARSDLLAAHGAHLAAALANVLDPSPRRARELTEARNQHKLAETLSEIADEDYRNLPEERDAWEFGEDIERRVKQERRDGTG